MTTRHFFSLLGLVLLSVTGASAPAVARISETLPRDLREIASRHGCAPIANFFERDGMVDPPFLYGFLPGPRARSAVFWCRRPGEHGTLLIEVIGSESRVALEWSFGAVAGLSLAADTLYNLENFFFADEPSKMGPSTRPAFRPVVADNDGTYTVFYRHGERWLMWMVD